MGKNKKNKEVVFNIAKELVQENGLSNLTIRNLATASQVSIGTIYNMFGTKENLIIELIKDYWEESINKTLESNKLKEGNFVDKIKNLVEEFSKIVGQFHKKWIVNVKDMSMSNKRIYKLSSKYRKLITNRIEEILLEEENIKKQFNEIFTPKKLAELIQDISIDKIDFDESDLEFLEVFLYKLFNIKD